MLRFTTAVGESFALPLARIYCTESVGEELHVEITADIVGHPDAQLIIEGAELEPLLDVARSRLATGFTMKTRLSSRRVPLWGWAVLAAILIPLGYILATHFLPAAHVFISVEQERALGDKIYETVLNNWTVCDNVELQQQVETLVEELASPNTKYDYDIILFESEDGNAFALPGGRILILTGLFDLCDSPEGLAGVLAHEIAHVEQRHSLKQLLRSIGVFCFIGMVVGGGVEQLETLETLTELSSLLVIFKYSRESEAEADRLAISTLHEHGISVQGLIEFFVSIREKYGLGKLEEALKWVSTHPLTELRIQQLEREREAEPKVFPQPNPAAHLEGHLQSACG